MPRRGFLFTGLGSLGAVDVGVLHALQDAGAEFEMVAGQGSGAVSAASVAGGIDPHQLGQLWLEHAAPRAGWLCSRLAPLSLLWRGGEVFRLRRDLWRALREGWLFDLGPLADALERKLREEEVRQGPKRLRILAWDLDAGERVDFSNDWYRHDHVLAACSLPHLMPAVPIERTRYCDPTFLAESSPLPPVALARDGVDELYFPLPRFRAEGRGAASTLASCAWRAWQYILERDLAALRARVRGHVPRLVPVPVEARLPATSGVDYGRPAIHRLLDLGYDHTREQAEALLAPPPAPAPEAPPARARTSRKAKGDGGRRPRRTEARPRKPRKKAVTRLQKALHRDGSAPRRRRKEPELGF